MKRIAISLAVFVCVLSANASWYWPFGESDGEDQPRLSELMSDATALIDDATELAAEGKIQESVEKYREALTELARIETANPERAATTEFASLRNKRAYVNAAIDSLLLAEARANAKAVAVTDTTELEKRYRLMKDKVRESKIARDAKETGKPADKGVEESGASGVSKSAVAEPQPKAKVAKKSAIERISARLARDPGNRKLALALIGEQIRAGKYDDAKAGIDSLLKVNMTDSSALNLKSVCEASRGDFKAAEATLDLVIQSHPRDFNGYYNMANLKLQSSGNRDMARRYYETGRALGGPADEALEAALK